MPIAVQVLRAFDNEKRSVVKSEILFFDQMLGRFLPQARTFDDRTKIIFRLLNGFFKQHS